jgi:hypothetical protein
LLPEVKQPVKSSRLIQIRGPPIRAESRSKQWKGVGTQASDSLPG